MLDIRQNVSLKPYNTFGIDAKADFFAEIECVEQLINLWQKPEFKIMPKLVLGGGSNILLLKDFKGIVIKINIKGITIIAENEENVCLEIASGENWNELVLFTVSKNWGGLENLTLIPGTVGAAPLQNIGAYGVEFKDVFIKLEALNIENLNIETFDRSQCEFGYRESVFKQKLKNKYVILNVTLKLQKNPIFKTEYGSIAEGLTNKGLKPSVKNISDTVAEIRKSKLPDPKEIGNSGSFFKNPEIEKTDFEQLFLKYPQMPHYNLANNKVKIPAGWLIEQAGWKGKRCGEVGVHNKQALVLVNYGDGTGQQIKELSIAIQKSVLEQFGVEIIPEVNFID